MNLLALNVYSIMMIVFLNLIFLCILGFLIYIRIRYKQSEDLLNKINALPIPVMIIDYATNTLYKSNNLVSIMFKRDDINNKNLSHINLFRDFNDYLNIKRNAEENIAKRDKAAFNLNSDYIILDITHILLSLEGKKYIIIALDDKTKLINYIKCLGIFTTIIDKSNEGVIISKFINNKLDPEIIYINDAITNITGYDNNDLINKSLLSNFFSKNIKEEDYEDIYTSITSFKPTTIECEYTKKTGDKCWVLVEIMAINKTNIENSLKKIDKDSCLTSDTINLNAYNIDLYITVKQTNISSFKNKEFVSKLFFDKMQSIAEEKIKSNEILMLSLMNYIKLKNDTTDLDSLISTVGKALLAERAYIVKFFGENDNKYVRYIYKWSNNNIKNNELNDELINNIMNTIDGYNIYANFITNHIYTIYTDEIKTDEIKKFYKLQNIQSSIMCPIFKDCKLIGFVGVDECSKSNRIWDFNSENILRIVAENLSSLI